MSQQTTFTLIAEELGGQATLKQIFNGNGCTGENISPLLTWKNPPEGTKSFAVTMYDPAAPSGSGWWHWVIFNIPATTDRLEANAGNVSLGLAPEGSIQSLNDYGQTGYGGPCPPEGDSPHPYIITLHALNTSKLDFDENTNPAMVGFAMAGKTLAKASIMVYSGRR